MKKAFTLAEIMIVLTVIGVLTAILLPAAFHSAPDENVMKFKKANSTLGTAIRELVNSDKYYADGDLGKMPDGTSVNSATYFCETFSDVLSTKSVNCSNKTGTYGSFCEDWDLNGSIQGNVKIFADKACKDNAKTIGAEITTTDGVVWYQTNPNLKFNNSQMYKTWNKTGSSEELTEFMSNSSPTCSSENKYYGHVKDCPEKGGFLYTYKVFCIDVDGIPASATKDDCVNECPFGYGIRVDGKIYPGARALEWINKSVQKGE